LEAYKKIKELGYTIESKQKRGYRLVSNTELLLPWEQIFYGEFDGRRKKRVLVKIIGE